MKRQKYLEDDTLFYVYILRCNDGTLYTGYTNNLDQRIKKHNEGKASKYTRTRLPVRILAKFPFATKSEAMKHEIKIKSLSREEKLLLLKQ